MNLPGRVTVKVNESNRSQFKCHLFNGANISKAETQF